MGEPFPRDISYTARPSAVERILLVKMEVERHDLAQDFSLLLCGPDLSVFPDDWFIDSLPRCNQSLFLDRRDLAGEHNLGQCSFSIGQRYVPVSQVGKTLSTFPFSCWCSVGSYLRALQRRGRKPKEWNQ